MCSICGRHICAPSCPLYSGKKIGVGDFLGNCRICKKAIYAHEKYIRKPEMILCDGCNTEASLHRVRKFLRKEIL